MTKAEYSAQRRVDARARGFCIQCYKRPATGGKTRCDECRAYQNKHASNEYRVQPFDRRGTTDRLNDNRTHAWCLTCTAFGFHRDDCKEAAQL